MSAWTFRAGFLGDRGEIHAERVTGERVVFHAIRFPAGWRVSHLHDACPRSVYTDVSERLRSFDRTIAQYDPGVRQGIRDLE